MREYINVKDAARLTIDILSPEYKNRHKEMLKKDITFEFSITQHDAHYNLTPYSFTPKIGSKLVSNLYVDMGQGFLECLQELSQDLTPHETTNKKV